jgi:hypothetical protein
MTKPTLYKHKTSARSAAVKALGKDAEFEIVATDDGRFYWIDTSAAAAEAAGKENDPGFIDVPTPEEAFEIAFDTKLPEPFPSPEEMAEDMMAAAAEPFEEPEPKADLKIDLGITPELAALIYGLGEAAGAAIPVPQKRRGITADAWAAAERGELPEPLAFPPSNSYAQKHANALRALADAGDEAGLAAYPITGTNTYSKALRSYAEALGLYLTNLQLPMQEAA